MGVRRQAREAALQALFRCDFLNEWDLEEVKFCLEHFSVPAAAQSFAITLCEGVINNIVAIDSKLTFAIQIYLMLESLYPFALGYASLSISQAGLLTVYGQSNLAVRLFYSSHGLFISFDSR